MKRILSLLFIGSFLLALAASCGSTKAGCDAYGDLNNSIEQSDLASK